MTEGQNASVDRWKTAGRRVVKVSAKLGDSYRLEDLGFLFTPRPMLYVGPADLLPERFPVDLADDYTGTERGRMATIYGPTQR